MSAELSTPPYPHIVVLWRAVSLNPMEKVRELHKVLRALWKKGADTGKPTTVADVPKGLRGYLTQAVSFKTLRSVYGGPMVKQMEAGEISCPLDMTIPDAIIVGRVRPAFDKEEFQDHLSLGKKPAQTRKLVRPARWLEGQSVEDAEAAFLVSVEGLRKEFKALSDRQAFAAGRDTSLITYVYSPLGAEPYLNGTVGFQVAMEFRQVTRLGKLSAGGVPDYEVVSEEGEFPITIPNRMEMMTLTKNAKDIPQSLLHNPFRDAKGRHIVKTIPNAVRGRIIKEAE